MKLLVFYYLCEDHMKEVIKKYDLLEDYFLERPEKYKDKCCDVGSCGADVVCRGSSTVDLDKEKCW